MAQDKPGQQGVWKSLASVKLAIIVLILIAVGSIAGTILPQGQSAEFYQHKYQGAAKLIDLLQLDNVYSSVWFLALLALLAINLIVCSIDRFPSAWKRANNWPDPDKLKVPNLRTKATLTSPKNPAEALEGAKEIFGGRGRLIQRIETDGSGGALFSQTGRYSVMGPYVVHLAILVFFVAGLASIGWGIQGFVTIHEGETVTKVNLSTGQEMELGYGVRLDKFIFKTYDTGAPEHFQSDLSFIKDGKVVKRAKVVVNGPANFGKLTFYQSNYGESLGSWVRVELKPESGEPKILRLPVGKHVDLDGVGRLEVLNFVDNIRGMGPGIRLGYIPPGKEQGEAFWILSRPPYQMRRNAKEVFRLVDFESIPYTGLQANYDPGVWFIWIGSSLMIIGLGWSFFYNHRRYWLAVEPDGSGSRIILAGSTNRNQPSFENDFAKLVDRIADRVGSDKPEEL